MVKNLKRTLALMLSIIMIFSSTLTAFADDEGMIASNEAETSAQIEETVAAEEEPSTEAPKAETATEAEQKEEAAPAQKAPEKPQAFDVELKDVAAYFGEDATFTIKTGGEVRSCQWQMSKDNGRRWSNLSKRQYGSSESLVIKADQKNNGRLFRCEVTFKNGAKALSDAARLKAQKAPTFPAVKFDSEKVDGVIVHVDAPEGAFPEGTTMDVAKVNLDAVQDVVDTTKSVEGKVVAAVDITFFDANGKEIEPNAPIKVEMASKEIAKVENPTVIHVDAKADDIAEADVEAEEVDATTAENGVKFSSDKFSIYAIVTPDEVLPEARATVNFYNGDTLIETFYVKNSDVYLEKDATPSPNVSYINDIVYDPGLGKDLGKKELFEGWSVDDLMNPSGERYTDSADYVGNDYTTETKPLNIDGVRKYLDTLNVKEGDVVNVYAMIFTYYNVTYFGDPPQDEGDPVISLGTHTKLVRPDQEGTVEVPYTVNMAYTPTAHQNFDGWKASEDTWSNITSVTEGERTVTPDADYIYPNNTKVTIKGDVVFHVAAPTGNWLVYEGNGKGATYNAPQFYLETEDIEMPETADPNYMSRKGYDFVGWYTVKYPDDATDIDPAKEFKFEGKLTDNVTIYAAWKAKTVAPYTVVLWGQNHDRTGYEVLGSYVNNNGQVGQNIPYTFVDNGDEDYVTGVGNGNGHYTGFCLTEASKNQQITIKPEGDSVLDLYYDRIVYNFKFYLYRESGTGRTPYTYANNSGSGRTLDNIVTWHGASANHPTVDGRTIQSETHRFGNTDYTYYYFTLQAYYGQTIAEDWPKYDEIHGADGHEAVSFVMMVGTKLKPNPTSGGSGTVKGVIQELNENILGATNDANGNYVVIRFPDSYYNWRYHIWHEAINGQVPEGKTSREYNGRTYYEETVQVVRSSNTEVSSQNEPKYPGFTFIEKRGQNWNNSNYWTTQEGNTTLYHLNYVYNREVYKIRYFDGNYVDGDDKTIQNRESILIHSSEDIPQGAAISDDYKNYTPPKQEEGYIFEGWYLDAGCTRKYEWSTMPIDGIKVYAKWRVQEYRIFLHPNADIEVENEDGTTTWVPDESLTWGSESQSMNFRLSWGEKISTPTGRRTEYEFIGWFWDPDFTQVYSAATEMNDGTVPASPEYDKTTDFTDDMDKWGHGATYNKDVDRPWITRKLDLYGQWRKKLVGAPGINVVYDAVDGTFTDGTNMFEDDLLYLDQAKAIAVGASTAKEGEQFLHWVLQKWDGSKYVDTETEVYPGDSFTVLLDLARSEEQPGSTPDKPIFKYTIQLRAEYGPAETETPTHITWYANGGTNEKQVVSDDKYTVYNTDHTLSYLNLRINESIPIPEVSNFTRPGYKFVGWAKQAEPSGAFDPENNTVDDTKYSEVDNLSLWLRYNDDGTFDEMNGTAVKTKGVTMVAADEKMPYDAIYAVWEYKGFFYVYHSSDKTVDKIDIAAMPTATYNLQTAVKGDNLYGGYFKAYFNVTDEQAKAAAEAKTPVDGAPVYTGAALYEKLTVDGKTKTVRYWTKTGDKGAYEDDGRILTPVKDTVYYLREISKDFLGLRVQVVYDWGSNRQIDDLYLITTVDNNIYSEAGFKITTDRKAALYASLSIQSRNSDEVTKITASDINAIGGYVGVWNGVADLVTNADANSQFTVEPYWITMDGVRVDDTHTPRTFNIGDKTFNEGTGLHEVK